MPEGAILASNHRESKECRVKCLFETAWGTGRSMNRVLRSLHQLIKSRSHMPDMYLRVDRVDTLVDAFQTMQDRIGDRIDIFNAKVDTSVETLRTRQDDTGCQIDNCDAKMDTLLYEFRNMRVEIQRWIEMYDAKIDRLSVLVNNPSLQPTISSTWEDRVRLARERKSRLLSFGPYTHGLLTPKMVVSVQFFFIKDVMPTTNICWQNR
jgi:hypothetical protein